MNNFQCFVFLWPVWSISCFWPPLPPWKSSPSLFSWCCLPCCSSCLSGNHLLCSFVASSISWYLSSTLLFLISHSDLHPPCFLPLYTPISSWKVYFQPRWFIQQVFFDFPHISKLYIIVPPSHLLLMYVLPQWMASTSTQKTKPKPYSLSLVYHPCLYLDVSLFLLPVVFHMVFSVSF